ncbi:ATP-binding cassette domain-containing protein [Microbacterium sp.]|uniref:ATP-binding cassette domain-containing protein n=1 Tax=Microbacterium sp. TaxID=51671 RepID=UPI00333EF0D5
MPDGQVLEFTRVTKRYGDVTALADFSARVSPGAVTGLLGPNGAGKTTTLRILTGDLRATSGTATIGGVPYSELRHPLRTVGFVLEDPVYRPRRTAERQLQIAAKANGLPASRVAEVLALVGLQNDADTRIGTFSLGMRQRLSVAGALLGDPGALVLDEPANGLDPEGIRWMRLLMRRLADEGRTVLVSSHVLSEVEQVADDVLVLAKGRAVYAGGIDTLSDPTTGAVIVDAEDRGALRAAIAAAGLDFDTLRSGITVRGSDAATVGALAAQAGIALTVLQQRGPSLEEVFLDLVYGRRPEIARPAPVAETADEQTAPEEEQPETDDEQKDADGSAAAAATAAAAAAIGGAGLFGAAPGAVEEDAGTGTDLDGDSFSAEGTTDPSEETDEIGEPGQHEASVETEQQTEEADASGDASTEHGFEEHGFEEHGFEDQPADTGSESSAEDGADEADRPADDHGHGADEQAADGDHDEHAPGDDAAEHAPEEHGQDVGGLVADDSALAEDVVHDADGQDSEDHASDEHEKGSDDQGYGSEDHRSDEHDAEDLGRGSDEQVSGDHGSDDATTEHGDEGHDDEGHDHDDADDAVDADDASEAGDSDEHGDEHDAVDADEASADDAAGHDEQTSAEHDGDEHGQASGEQPITTPQDDETTPGTSPWPDLPIDETRNADSASSSDEHGAPDDDQPAGEAPIAGLFGPATVTIPVISASPEFGAVSNGIGLFPGASSDDSDSDDVVDDVVTGIMPVVVSGTPVSADEAVSEEESPEPAEAHDEFVENEPTHDEPVAEATDTDEPGAEEHDSDPERNEDSAEETPEAESIERAPEDESTVLPFATQAISVPSETREPTFTELITGIPASEQSDEPEQEDSAEEAPAEGGDEDPRMDAMRASIAAAAKAYFEDPAPAYPYGQRDEQSEGNPWSLPKTPLTDATHVIDTVPKPEDGEQDEDRGDEHRD